MQMGPPGLFATALKLTPEIHPSEGYPIAYTPEWRTADGTVEQAEVCNHTFDLEVDEFTEVALQYCSCADGVFFLYRTAKIDAQTYDHYDPTYTLFFVAKSSIAVVELGTYQRTGFVEYTGDQLFITTEDGKKVTYIDYAQGDKICFVESEGVWTVNRYALGVFPLSFPSEDGWVDASGENIYALAGDSDGMFNFLVTPMSASGGFSHPTFRLSGGETNIWLAPVGGFFFATPFNTQSKGVYLAVDTTVKGLLYVDFNPTEMSATLLVQGSYNLYSRVQTQVIFDTEANGALVAFDTYSTYPAAPQNYGGGSVGVVPAGYSALPPPSSIGGADDFGEGSKYQKLVVRSDTPAAIKVCRYSDEGVTPNTLNVIADGFSPAVFSDDSLTNEKFVAIWVGEGGTLPPELYSEFFTSFTKSYEVRGYKA